MKPGAVAFYGTIAALAAVTLLLRALPAPQPPPPAAVPAPQPVQVEIAQAVLDRLSGAAALGARRDVSPAEIDAAVARAFAPVRAAIEPYVEHHYSLAGEYEELMHAATRQLAEDMAERLFADQFEAALLDGLDTRIGAEAAALLGKLDDAFAARMQAGLAAAVPSGAALTAASRLAVEDTLGRMRVTAPVAALTATGGAVGVKVLAQAAGKKMAGAFLAKLAAKGAVKGVGAGSAAAGGAAAGAVVGGPVGAVVGGVAGAVAAWVAADYAVLKLDELMNRETFTADIEAAVAAQEDAVRAVLGALLDRRAETLAGRPLSEVMAAPPP